MRVLVMVWEILVYGDVVRALEDAGFCIEQMEIDPAYHLSDEGFEERLADRLRRREYAFVFSINFMAVLGRICYRQQVRYVSWNVDTPLISMQTPAVYYPTNRIFTFDREEYQTFHRLGAPIRYLPLCGTDRCPVQQKEEGFDTQDTAGGMSDPGVMAIEEEQKYDLSFIGNLYDKNRYDEMAQIMPDYLCGYLDAAIEAQRNIICGNLLSELITPEVFVQIRSYIRSEQMERRKDLYRDVFEYLPEEALDLMDGDRLEERMLRLQFITRVLAHKVASDQRKRWLNGLGRRYAVHLFTTSDTGSLHHVQAHGAVGYPEEMAKVIRDSRINLNMTAPNITAGIPLRVWDILSAGGFVLTDYREAYQGLLKDGQDLVLYNGWEDLLQKADYYLTHPQERKQIARQGHDTLCQYHTYADRIKKMLEQL